jgi:ribosomal protein S18 acetylase RimI-like enzyme
MERGENGIRITSLAGQESLRKAVADVFVDAYFPQLSFFTKDKDRLSNAFLNSFLLERFYGAFSDGELVGIFALTDETGRCFKLVKSDLVDNIGFLKANLVFGGLKKEFEHPIRLRSKGFNIEAVAVRSDQRGKGIATSMMRFAQEHADYLELDVADTNLPAIKIYEKLGFKVFKEVPVKHFKRIVGYGKRLYMSYPARI